MRCKAQAQSDSEFCFVHDPENLDKRLAAAAKGGKLSKKTNLNLEPLNLKKSSDIVILLEQTINKVRAGEMSAKVANSVGYLSGHLLNAIEASDIQERLEVIERVIFERKQVKKR